MKNRSKYNVVFTKKQHIVKVFVEYILHLGSFMA